MSNARTYSNILSSAILVSPAGLIKLCFHYTIILLFFANNAIRCKIKDANLILACVGYQ